MSQTIQIGNIVLVLDAIAAIEHKSEAGQVEVVLKSGATYLFSHPSSEASTGTFNTLRMSFSEAGFGSTYISL